jgi:hypothetical protein
MRRREFIALVGGAAVASPNVVARAQQLKLPEIGFLFGASREAASPFLPGLRCALMEAGYAEGQNVAIEYRWADLHFDRLPALADELVRRRVAVIISTGGIRSTEAAMDATKLHRRYRSGEARCRPEPQSLGRQRDRRKLPQQRAGAKRLGLLHDTVARALRGEKPRACLTEPAACARYDDDFSFDVVAHELNSCVL